MKRLEAKKSLGQHFLRSDKAINQIIEGIKNREQIVFEIGPGEGVLTEKLLAKNFTVVVIEIDKRSIELLENKFAKELKNKKLFIINKDCLEVDYEAELNTIYLTQPLLAKERSGAEYTLIGNIPYYITGAIFRNTFEQSLLPSQAIFLVQKEVAERIVARDKKESILSVSVKIFSPDVKIIDIVKAGSFVPPPKVDSAIITINNILSPFEKMGGSNAAETQEIFFKILRASFSHKRKFLLTNLKTDLEEKLLVKYSTKLQEIFTNKYSEKIRAEDVALEVWREVVALI